ncbi:MAG: diguanylate cyclase domain-containing protein [Planctomycetia bacterium]
MAPRAKSSLPQAPRSSALGRWLLVGAPGPGEPPPGIAVERAAGVHEALALLAWRRVERVWVGAAALRSRPRAALRALEARAGAGSVAVVAAGLPPRLQRAAAACGVPVRPALGPLPAEAAPPGRHLPLAREVAGEVTRTRFEQVLDLPEAGDEDEAPRPLPRADLAVRLAPSVDVEAFAAGCLARLERPGAISAFLLRTLAEASDAARLSLLLRDASGESLVLRSVRGVDEALLGKVRVPDGQGVAGRAALLGRPTCGVGSCGGQRDYEGASYVVLPLGRRAACEGVVSLTGFPGDRLPSPEEVRAWSRLALQAGRAMRAARRLRRAEACATRDALTGLPNRRAFTRALRREADRAQRAGRGMGLAVLDVDRFKRINDSLGHPAGDAVLREVATRLCSALRDTDLVARWGGEEFALLLPDLGSDAEGEARLVAERARAAVAARPILAGAGHPGLVVTLSAGVAVGPLPGRGSAALLEAADRALLAAKQGGRNRLVSARLA